MNKKFVLVTLIPSVVSLIPLYSLTVDYMSYFYWVNHQKPCYCPQGVVCTCAIDTGLICKNAYENHDYTSFHDVCTIHRFDGEYASIQFTSIGISIIPVVISAGLLSAIYLRQKVTTSK